MTQLTIRRRYDLPPMEASDDGVMSHDTLYPYCVVKDDERLLLYARNSREARKLAWLAIREGE